MRNPNRLNDFYDILKGMHKYWYPDLRFGQFILNINNWYKNKYNKDIFYLEETDFLTKVNEFHEEGKEVKNA